MQKESYFAKLFEEQKAITEIEKIEPPTEEEVIARWGEGPSPLSKEDILRMLNVELAEYLREFKTKDRREGPTAGGLVEVLKSAVKENPTKFVDDLTPFLSVNHRYVYNILYGLADVWKEKKSFDWGRLLNFAKEYIRKPNFWEEGKKTQGEDWSPTHVWIINVIADLIQEGTRDDSWAFAEDYFSQAEEILDIMTEKLPVEKNEGKETYRDAVTEALNTSYGKVIAAMILLSLRKARVEDKEGIKKEVRWEPNKYENLFRKGVIEAFTLFGQYMPNLAYLNKKWVKMKIREFESLSSDDICWQSFIQGYLFGHRVYQDLYVLMRNHYLKAIDSDFKEEDTEKSFVQTEKSLVQHITIGYLRGNESLEGEESLFKKVIDKWKYSQLREIVNFFWTQSDYLIERAK